jgi:hypothetical protein
MKTKSNFFGRSSGLSAISPSKTEDAATIPNAVGSFVNKLISKQ